MTARLPVPTDGVRALLADTLTAMETRWSAWRTLEHQAAVDTGLRVHLRAAIEHRTTTCWTPPGLNSEVFDAPEILAAGSCEPMATAAGGPVSGRRPSTA